MNSGKCHWKRDKLREVDQDGHDADQLGTATLEMGKLGPRAEFFLCLNQQHGPDPP
ncbi:hypothetical protein [Peribacillus frigoritolerans]|uniref:hypothetical protein n=1 Tax=Peribacillus castrilensis TaxID=2897690 RepID=UPI002DC82646|nr:hypothetical protein [Peribacillus castrilensis]